MTTMRPVSPLARRRLLSLSALAVAASCASPSPALYTLAAIPGAELGASRRTIEMRAIGLARYLERSQIVRSSENFRLDILGNEWWGEPLDTMMSRVMTQNLTQRLPNATVFAESGAVSALADALLGINVQRLDQDRAGAIILLAQVSVTRRGETIARTFSIQVVPTAADTPSLVAAMSHALGQLADRVARLVAG